jgi:hypothetical protein
VSAGAGAAGQSANDATEKPTGVAKGKGKAKPKAKASLRSEAQADPSESVKTTSDNSTATAAADEDENASASVSVIASTGAPAGPPETAIKAMRGRAKGTLGRGKQARGTVLWSSDASPSLHTAVEEARPAGGAEGAGDSDDDGDRAAGRGADWKQPKANVKAREDEDESAPGTSTSAGDADADTGTQTDTSNTTASPIKAGTSPSKVTLEVIGSSPRTSPTKPSGSPRQIITPSLPSPTAEKVSYTAATSPLNPPRSLSKSPDARTGPGKGQK